MIWGRIKAWLAAAGAFVLVLAGVAAYFFTKGRKSAKQDAQATSAREQVEVTHEQVEAIKEAHEVAQSVHIPPVADRPVTDDAGGDDDADVLRRWSRD